MTEAGIPEATGQAWNGMVTRAGTPPEVVAKIHRDVVAVLKQPVVVERLSKLSFNIVGNSPEQFGEVIRSDAAKWGKVIRDFKIQVE